MGTFNFPALIEFLKGLYELIKSIIDKLTGATEAPEEPVIPEDPTEHNLPL